MEEATAPFVFIQPIPFNQTKNKELSFWFAFISFDWIQQMEWKWIKKYYNSMDNTDHTGWKLEEMKNF